MLPYITRYLAIDEYKKWDELVSQSPASNIFDKILWLDTLTNVLDCKIKILGVFKDENLIGGVVFNVIQKLGMKIANVPPMSHFNSCHYIPRETHSLDKQGKHIQAIIKSIAERLQNDFHYVVIANHPELQDIRGFLWKDWNQNILYAYRIYLDKMDLSLISPSKRRWVIRAKKKLITTEEIMDLAPVYEIIKKTYTRQNIQCPLTFDEMSDICRKMGNNIVILAAREQKKRRYVSVYISLVDSENSGAYGLFSGYDHEFADTGANALLQWKEIEHFQSKGFKFLDFGQAGSPSKASFKSQFNADPVPFYRVSKSNLLFSIVWHLTKGRIIQIQ